MRPRRTTSAPSTLISIDPDAGSPLNRQVYADLRAAIVNGRLAPGTQIPSTRLLATELGLSRTTVAAAVDQLRAEGYVVGRERAGTYVAAEIPDRTLAAPAPRRNARSATREPRNPTWPSARGARLEHLTLPRSPWEEPRPFRSGMPATDAFPAALWAKLTTRAWRRPSRELRRVMTYGDPAGYAPLRRAIASYVAAARAAACAPEQVIVVSGSQQALGLAALVLLDPGDAMWMEDPGYLGARRAFEAAEAVVVPVPVDGEGLIVDEGIRRAPDARLAYVTPSYQYPLGVTMSAARRLQLLAWARGTGAWVVEDDYDSEFRYSGRPLACLQGLAPNEGCVVYVGTFSKTLFPALRLGYMIVPDSLVDAFANARATLDRHSPAIEQVVLTDFIADGHFARHVRRMRALYGERRETLMHAATNGPLADWVTLGGSDAGMHVVGELRPPLRDVDAARAALDAGIEVVPLSRFALEPIGREALLFGYAAFSPAAIRRAAERLARALRDVDTHSIR